MKQLMSVKLIKTDKLSGESEEANEQARNRTKTLGKHAEFAATAGFAASAAAKKSGRLTMLTLHKYCVPVLCPRNQVSSSKLALVRAKTGNY